MGFMSLCNVHGTCQTNLRFSLCNSRMNCVYHRELRYRGNTLMGPIFVLSALVYCARHILVTRRNRVLGLTQNIAAFASQFWFTTLLRVYSPGQSLLQTNSHTKILTQLNPNYTEYFYALNIDTSRPIPMLICGQCHYDNGLCWIESPTNSWCQSLISCRIIKSGFGQIKL